MHIKHIEIYIKHITTQTNAYKCILHGNMTSQGPPDSPTRQDCTATGPDDPDNGAWLKCTLPRCLARGAPYFAQRPCRGPAVLHYYCHLSGCRMRTVVLTQPAEHGDGFGAASTPAAKKSPRAPLFCYIGRI